MEEANKGPRAEVEEILAKQALALNYEYGMTSRILPVQSAEGSHSVQLLLDLTHSGLEFDLEFTVRFSDEPDGTFSWELVAPENAGGRVWQEVHRSLDDLKRAVAGLPYYVQGFFAGRAAQGAVGTAGGAHGG